MRREGVRPQKELSQEKKGFLAVKEYIDKIVERVARQKLGKRPKIKRLPQESDTLKDD